MLGLAVLVGLALAPLVGEGERRSRGDDTPTTCERVGEQCPMGGNKLGVCQALPNGERRCISQH